MHLALAHESYPRPQRRLRAGDAARPVSPALSNKGQPSDQGRRLRLDETQGARRDGPSGRRCHDLTAADVPSWLASGICLVGRLWGVFEFPMRRRQGRQPAGGGLHCAGHTPARSHSVAARNTRSSAYWHATTGCQWQHASGESPTLTGTYGHVGLNRQPLSTEVDSVLRN